MKMLLSLSCYTLCEQSMHNHCLMHQLSSLHAVFVLHRLWHCTLYDLHVFQDLHVVRVHVSVQSL